MNAFEAIVASVVILSWTAVIITAIKIVSTNKDEDDELF